MIHFIGAGPGAADLITVRGAEALRRADVIIYAGSLVNPALLEYAREGCRIYNSAKMTLEEVIEVMKEAEAEAKIAIAKAKGQAEAQRIQGDGEAYYNRVVAASLNALLVQQYAIEKWNGEMPTYNGTNALPFINLGK